MGGCKDRTDWSRCNVTGDCTCGETTEFESSRRLQTDYEWNCTRYYLEGMCNETYYGEVDCEGMEMRIACRSACCLCDSGLPPHCGIVEEQIDVLPFWLLPAAIGAGVLLLLVFICSCVSWKRRWCHSRYCCKRCCRCLDRCAGR